MSDPEPKGETVTTTETQSAEPVSAELVRPDDEIDRQQRADVERFADVALAMPGSAGYEEFKTLCLQAKMLSMSAAAPKAIKGNPHVALHIVMIGRDLGISASAAVELIDVIDTKEGMRPSLSPQLINGQIRRLGLGHIAKAIDNHERCVALALGPGGRIDIRCVKSGTYPFHWYDLRDDNGQLLYADLPDERKTCGCTPDLWIGDTEFSWQDAQLAGLVGPECTPTAHKKQTKQSRSGGTYEACPCNFGYMAYWPRMRWWRASGFCADDWFPEAGLGLYTAEELGAFVDADGRAIDVDSIELPEGYEAHKGTPGYVAPPSEEEQQLRVELQMRVLAMPKIGQDEYRNRKKNSSRLSGVATYQMDLGQLRMANSILGGVEAFVRTETAKTDEPWDSDAALADVQQRYVVAEDGRVVEKTDEQQTDEIDAEDAGEEQTTQDTSETARTDEATTEKPKRSRRGKNEPVESDAQTDALKEIVTAMGAHAAKLTEILDNVTKLPSSEVVHMLESDRFMVKASSLPNDDSRKQRLVIELCREYLAEQQPPAEQATLDGTAE